MKKIVGILAGAAVLATSVFAADVSAKVKLDGSLFNFNGNDVGMLSITHKAENWNPDLAFSVSDDAAGASFKIYSADRATTEDSDKSNWRLGNTFQENAYYYQIWVKPIDMLKITLGQVGTNLNQEHIDWSNTNTGIDSYGYGLNVSVDAFSMDLILAPGWSTLSNTDNYWFGKKKDADATVAETYLIGKYGADFGTIGAYLDATNTFANLEFGAGYSNNFSGINMFAQVIGYVDTKAKKDNFTKVELEAYADGSVDAFTWAVFVRPALNIPMFSVDGAKACDQIDLFATAKVTYKLDSVTPFLYVKCSDFIPAEKAFAVEVKPGVDGNVGAASWEIALDMNISNGDTAFTIDVPVSMSIGF